MKKTKQIDTYYCDYCGKECEHTTFVIPERTDNCEYATDFKGNKLIKFDFPTMIAKSKDICPDCQNKIATLLSTLPLIKWE